MSGSGNEEPTARLILLQERGATNGELPVGYLKAHHSIDGANIVVQYRTASGIDWTTLGETLDSNTLVVIEIGDQLAGVQGEVADKWQEIATELEEIKRGDDLTGLAMTWNKHLDTPVAQYDPPVVWFDSLSKMLQYVDIDSVVRFLQVCLGSLDEAGATGHFLCRSTTVDPAAITTLRRVFSTVIRIEENGWTIVDQ